MARTGTRTSTTFTPRAAESFLRAVPVPKRLYVPLIGVSPTDVTPLPAGTEVQAGDTLTPTVPQASPAPLAAVKGIACGVGKAMLASGREVPAIVLETAEGETPPSSPASAGVPDLEAAMRPLHGSMLGSWIDRLRHAGVWANRWASPDLLAQLNQCLWRPVDTLICSALDLDAALPIQAAHVRARGADVFAGVAALAKLTGATSVWVVVDTATGNAVPRELIAKAEAAGVRLVPVENEYPRANPTILLHALTRRKLPHGALPTTHGVLLLDAIAAADVGANFLRESKVLTVPLAVHSDVRGSHFLASPVGCPIRDALAFVNISTDRVTLRTGSPLRDIRVRPETVVSAGGELTVFVTTNDEDPPPDPCIRCAWCVEGCPVQIQPAALLEASQRDDSDMAERYGIDACIECGICSFVCPSRLPLLQGIRVLRAREKEGPPLLAP